MPFLDDAEHRAQVAGLMGSDIGNQVPLGKLGKMVACRLFPEADRARPVGKVFRKLRCIRGDEQDRLSGVDLDWRQEWCSCKVLILGQEAFDLRRVERAPHIVHADKGPALGDHHVKALLQAADAPVLGHRGRYVGVDGGHKPAEVALSRLRIVGFNQDGGRSPWQQASENQCRGNQRGHRPRSV